MTDTYKVCAHALPLSHPFEGGSGVCYPVRSHCKYAKVETSRQKDGEWVLRKKELHMCNGECALFTDTRIQQLMIRNDAFRATIYIDHLNSFTVADLRKLLNLLGGEHWNNREAVELLDSYLPEKIASTKELWRQAAYTYQDQYRLPDNYPPKRRREIKAANTRLINAVKSAKALHERWVKIRDIWNETKTKFKID